MSTREIVDIAIEKWHGLTGVSPDQTTFRLGDLDIRSMNEALTNSLELEPEGTTAYLLLECFLRSHLEDKTFTAAQIIKDYKALSTYLAKAEDLFSILQSEYAIELAATFRAKVKQGAAAYKADTQNVIDLIDDMDALPFLRRDAIHALNNLTPYQFLAGEYDSATPQVVEHIYQAWDINQLLLSLRDMPVSGIAVVLLRDPANPDRSYFSFAMRNGENVTLFTDKKRPAFPGQEDRMRGRGRARDYARRAWENHFPYQLIKTHLDDRGDVVFDKETAPVISGQDLVPLMRIQDLPAHQIIWLTMMLSLIADKFWKKKWGAKALSYTGNMVQDKTLLVTDKTGAKLPVSKGYTPLGLDRLTLKDISRDTIKKQVERTTDVNKWLEDRYAHTVDEDTLNLWVRQDDELLLLPALEQELDRGSQDKVVKGTQLTPYVKKHSKREIEKAPFWNHPKGYKLQSFTPTMFGTEEELINDSRWIARYNLAQHIQREANKEYHARKAEVAGWYHNALSKNLEKLCEQAAAFHKRKIDGENPRDNLLQVAAIKDKIWEYSAWGSENVLGDYQSYNNRYLCALNETAATWRAHFTPRTVEDLVTLTGTSREKLPDVLQNWQKEEHYVGNGILDRLDPVEYSVDNPWRKLPLRANLYLSKRAMTKLLKS